MRNISTSIPAQGGHSRSRGVSARCSALRVAADFQAATNLGELAKAMVAAGNRASAGELAYIQHFSFQCGKVGALASNIPWPFDTDEQQACARHFLRHPMVVSTSGNTNTARVTISEVLPTRRWREQTIYNEVFRRHRFDYQQALNFPLGAGGSCALVIMRSGFDYTEREKKTFDLVRRMAIPALRRILRIEQIRAELELLSVGVDEAGLAVIGLDENGRLARFSREASRLLAEHEETLAPGSLMEEISRWLKSGNGEAHVLPTALGALRVRRSPATLRGSGFLFVEEVQRHSPPPTYQSHGLSKRESEVLHGITLGRGDAQIALEMGIGLRSVHEYCGRIFTKLGVSNRNAAAAAARRMVLKVPAHERWEESHLPEPHPPALPGFVLTGRQPAFSASAAFQRYTEAPA